MGVHFNVAINDRAYAQPEARKDCLTMPNEPVVFVETSPPRNAMLKALENKFPGCGIIYVTLDLKAGMNATWSRQIPPLAVAGYLRSIAANIEQQLEVK